MAKLIAVCGSPDSGKTTLSLKLAQEIYTQNKSKSSVIFISTDLCVPVMAYIFPNGKDENLHSLGKALDKTDIFKEDIIRQFVNVNTMKNFAYLGFKLGENKYSYPTPTEDKVVQLLNAARASCDYVIVDCSSYEEDIIGRIAKRDCDIAIQLFNPDIRCITYYASCVNQFMMIEGKSVKVLNIMDNDLYLPIEEAKKHFKDIKYSLPYSRELKKQMITGTLSEGLHDTKYRAELRKLIKEVI